MNIAKRSLLTLSCLSALLSAAPAWADLVLTLTSGTSSVTIHDGGVGDANGTAGAIGFVGTVGNFQLNFSGNPDGFGLVNGASSHDPATLWLTSLIATSKGAGTLTIQLYDDSFAYQPGINMATTSVSGITNGSVDFRALLNANTTSHFSSNGPVFNNSQTIGPVDTTGGFSLTQIATITHTATGRQVTSFDMISTVPEPTTLGLFGIGLVGLAFIRRRKETK